MSKLILIVVAFATLFSFSSFAAPPVRPKLDIRQWVGEVHHKQDGTPYILQGYQAYEKNRDNWNNYVEDCRVYYSSKISEERMQKLCGDFYPFGYYGRYYRHSAGIISVERFWIPTDDIIECSTKQPCGRYDWYWTILTERGDLSGYNFDLTDRRVGHMYKTALAVAKRGIAKRHDPAKIQAEIYRAVRKLAPRVINSD